MCGNTTGRLDLLTEALASYLEEIDGYRSICLRHERTVVVYATGTAVHLVRRFPWADATLAYLRDVLARLPRWRQSLFWQADGPAWVKVQCDITQRAKTDVPDRDILTRGVTWDGRPILVCVISLPRAHLLQVELLLLPVTCDLPELPLRRVASGLRCHEYLVPDWIAQPVPSAPLPPGLAIQQFLTRATPQNLYASKCFQLGGAEK